MNAVITTLPGPLPAARPEIQTGPAQIRSSYQRAYPGRSPKLAEHQRLRENALSGAPEPDIGRPQKPPAHHSGPFIHPLRPAGDGPKFSMHNTTRGTSGISTGRPGNHYCKYPRMLLPVIAPLGPAQGQIARGRGFSRTGPDH